MNIKTRFDRKITDKIYESILNKMPQISKTEQDAIDAGDTWIEGDIFKGNINWSEILNSDTNSLNEKEKDFIINKIPPLLEMIDEEKIEKDKDLPKKVWSYLKKEKFFSFIIPESFGGLGFSAKANSTIVSILASVSSTLAVTVMVPNSLGPAELLIKYGTEKQKNKWLNNLAKGKDIPCFALTSEDAGSDAGGLTDIGIIKKKEIDGKEIIGIEVNFSKRYITLAPIATVMGIAFKLYDPNHIISDIEDRGITLALIPTNKDGIDNSNRHDPMGLSFMNGPIFGEKVFIEIDEIIGGKEMIGKGWRMLVECLSAGRGISLPALSGAISQNCMRISTAYSLIREQFNTPIHNFEGIQESLLTIISNNHIINATREFMNKSLDDGYNPSIASAITKYHTTELARESLMESMDILGGKAIIQGDLNPISDAYKGIPIAITVEGANILTRYLMIFGQGSIRCHEFLLKEIDAINNENKEKGKDDFNKIFKKHIKSTASKSLINLLSGLTFNLFNSSPRSEFKNEIKIINHLSRSLNIYSDITLLDLGGKLKYKEYLSSRLGDVLSYLFMAVSVIYYSQLKNDKKLSKYCVNLLIYRAYQAFNDFNANYHSLGKSHLMKHLNFPFGIPNKKPEFKTYKSIVDDYIYSKEKRESELQESSIFNNKIAIIEDSYIVHLNHHLNEENLELMSRVRKYLDKKLSIEENLDILSLNGTINNKEKNYLINYFESKRSVIKVNHIKK